jgi:hypothetical protein
MNNETHISTFARLLATENISVRHDKNAETASFNVVDRILTLPRWKVVDSHLYDMLIGHEVAHALWTPGDMDEESGCLAACVEIDPEHPEHAMGFLNIVEDARIERMIKNKFPGLRRDFNAGYSYLHNDLDMFELSCDQSKIAKMGLTDRLNVHFKLGILGIVAVPFSADEQVYVDRMETTDTWEDVIELARDLYEKAKRKHEQADVNMIDIEIGADGEPIDGEENEDGQEVPGNSTGPGLEPETANVLQGMEREKQRQYHNDADQVVDLPTPRLDNMIIESDVLSQWWDDHLKTGSGTYLAAGCDAIRKECVEWMRSEQPTVKNLVKQFEMRKAADEHKRTMISKSGRLDTVKMIDYKWSEDIFAKNTIVREGKNHGIVIFVDWSGSMGDVIEPVMKQALTLAMFAQQANIPFEVFAFSDRPYCRSWEEGEQSKDLPENYWNQESTPTYSSPEVQDENNDCDWEKLNRMRLGRAATVRLFRFLHSGMNRRDFQSAAEIFYLSAIGNCYGREGVTCCPPSMLQLNGTPLDDTILAAHEVVMNFRRRNNLQVVNCAILTDGCGASHGFQDCSLRNPYTGIVYGDRPEHRQGQNRMGSTNLLLRSLRETTGCNLIGMYLHSGKNPHNCWGWVKDEYNSYAYGESENTKKQKKTWKDENFCIADGDSASQYDEAYIISAGTKVEQEMELPEASQVSHVKLRNTFVKNLKRKGMSRTLIRRFVEMIAR